MIVPYVVGQVSGPTPDRITRYGVAEFRVETGETYRNPFDPDEVAVDGTFTSAKGARIALPAYWDGTAFRLRFCPTEAGEWRIAVSVAKPGSQRNLAARAFRVAPSSLAGFVKTSPKNPRYFALDSGKGFVPIGLNICWPDKSGVGSYDNRFAKLASVGGNFARIWTTQERQLETKQAGLGRYDEGAAGYYDEVFRLAARHGIRTMWTLDDYRVLAKTDYFNAHWSDSPYNAANGGPLTEPTDFFTDPRCNKLYRQRLRYLVARYSAFDSLAFWELYNEQDNIPEPGVPIAWFREMTDYLASIDPYRHPITTSYSWQDKAEVWQSPALGLTQAHLYGQDDTVDFVSMIQGSSRKLDAYGKPRLIGEFGITWKQPDIALDKAKLGTPLHDALWASLLTGDAGGALTWWWDNYLEPLNLWPVFEGFSRFVAPLDFANHDYRPYPLQVSGLTALALRDGRTGDLLVWLHDPDSNWKADAAGSIPREWTGVKLQVPLLKSGSAQVWDTRSGLVVARPKVRPVSGIAQVSVPTFRRDIALRISPQN
jgi:hypothetical protein